MPQFEHVLLANINKADSHTLRVYESTGGYAATKEVLTKKSPLWGGGDGEYIQNVDTSKLSEGYHYITVRAYRHRDEGGNTATERRLGS